MQSDFPVNILLVDDRPQNLLALEAILEPLNQNLVRALSGQEALKRLLRDDYAVILLDVQMPGIDGFETAQLIKEREKTRHIPIIFVTAISTDERYITQGYSSGAVDYIPKPFNPDILKSKVSVFVDLFKKTEQIKQQAELLRQSEQRDKERQMAEQKLELDRKHMAVLAESEERFRLLMENVRDYAILLLDTEGNITNWSLGAQRIFGYSDAEVMGLHADLIFTEEDRKNEIPEAEMSGAIADGRAEDERWHIRKDGTHFWASGIMTSLRDAEGNLRGFVKVLSDTTERKRLQDSLIVAKEEAERANLAKSEFIASVSHELRTPLNAILGFSKLLLNPRVGDLNEDQELYTRDIVQSAEHLLQLINDILDLSKIEAGKLELELSQFSLIELLDQSLTIIREKAKQHNLKVQTQYAPEVLALDSVLADARKIKQIMYNLLSNAVKFTPDNGSITIRALCEGCDSDDAGTTNGVNSSGANGANGNGANRSNAKANSAKGSRAKSSGARANGANSNGANSNGANGAKRKTARREGARIVVSVEDTGIGIPAEAQQRVFGAFEQVDSSHTRQQQGTGLGLALTKRMVELYGGDIWLQSEVDQGSTFSFSIPLLPETRVAETDTARDSAVKATGKT